MGSDDKHKHNHNHNHTDTGGDLPDVEHQKKRSRYAPEDTRGSISKVVVVILLLIAITALVLWLLYRPHKPKFTVAGVAVVNLNTATPPTTITALQLTLVNRNPNNRVSIYYNHLVIFLSNKNQPITPPLMLPPLHHKSDSTVVMAPMLPLSPEVVNGLASDGGNGAPVSLRVVLTGKRKWKYGGVKSGWKSVYVGCDVVIGLKKGVMGQVPLLGPSVCKVDI
uniref:NDR1/HIN1-like protein 12 n=1 Tax=Erigeron canadensis TaxID=72917 RepID=UPI001CB968D9|nr:NDR1/HIN1-like protein 12 [Erigeron canadensis]